VTGLPTGADRRPWRVRPRRVENDNMAPGSR
jgi:hypothetical protein